MIDIIDTTCEDHFPEVLTVQKSIHPLSASPTHSSNSIIASPSLSLTPPENSDFLLEETDAFPALGLIPPGIDNEIFDVEGDILFLEKLLNIDSTKDLPPRELNNEYEGEILFLEKLLKEEAKNSKIDTFLMGDKEIKFSPLKDIDDPVPIPRVSKKPLDSLDLISKAFEMTITNPLFDFDSEFTLNSDNPIFDIQNEKSDESDTETIIEEVQIHSSQSTAQIPPPYGKLTFDLTMLKPILTFSHSRYGIFGSYHVFDTLGPRQFSCLSYYFSLDFPKEYLKFLSLNIFLLGDENEVFDPGIIIVYVDSKV
ncbi:hypothetical protein Tco_1305984 [Tanacetum coccineum]